jgi:hypothetical protein
VQCQDIFGTPVVDRCSKQTQLFSGEGFSSDESGTPLPDTSATPPGGGEGQCDPLTVKKMFVDKINTIMASEGLGYSWSPDFSQPQQTSFWHQAYASKAATICATDIDDIGPGVEERTECDDDAVKQGRCYCEDSFGLRCRCARITSTVLVQTCAERPPDCDEAEWSEAVWDAYGAATKTLDDGSGYLVPDSGDGGDSGGGSFNPKNVPTVPGAGGGGQPPWTCVGSPLVLDLAGDGLALSSLEQGVRFDLHGTGPGQMAWTRGADDALLALDRDGNGRIDHGGELFGEATLDGGPMGRDGFAALAVLDRPDHGGNGNGLVERGDLLFDQLVLWTDRDHDGVSDPGELTDLPGAGVAAIDLTATAHSLSDRYGNDLGLRGRFLRADGSRGLVVDVYFVTGAHP